MILQFLSGCWKLIHKCFSKWGHSRFDWSFFNKWRLMTLWRQRGFLVSQSLFVSVDYYGQSLGLLCLFIDFIFNFKTHKFGLDRCQLNLVKVFLDSRTSCRSDQRVPRRVKMKRWPDRGRRLVLLKQRTRESFRVIPSLGLRSWNWKVSIRWFTNVGWTFVE